MHSKMFSLFLTIVFRYTRRSYTNAYPNVKRVYAYTYDISLWRVCIIIVARCPLNLNHRFLRTLLLAETLSVLRKDGPFDTSTRLEYKIVDTFLDVQDAHYRAHSLTIRIECSQPSSYR